MDYLDPPVAPELEPDEPQAGAHADAESSAIAVDEVLAAAPITAAEATSPKPEPATPAPTVGVFDSGIGGFTVAQALLNLRPELNLLYFGDSMNLPYGAKSAEQLQRLSHGNIDFLLSRGAELIAVGCQTSNSILGADELARYSVPVFDLIGSTIQSMRAAGPPQRVAVLATEATIRTRYWERELERAFTGIRVRPVPCPLLVPLIEDPRQDHKAILAALESYLNPLIEDGISDIILGCTHYPLLLDYIYQIDRGLNCIDPSQCLAGRLAASLPAAPEGSPVGRRRFYSSRPGERFYVLGQRVFGHDIRPWTRMCIVNPRED